MNIKDNLPTLFVVGIVIAGGAIMISKGMGPSDAVDLEEVVIPEFSVSAKKGNVIYNDNCDACHGENGVGTDQGPPFLNKIYNPGHHSNEAFLAAVQRGVQQHHWNFGNMPAQPQLDIEDVKSILAYVRELQRANGIKYQKHMM